MAAMLVCTSWPRMEAEPPLGGKRPLKMDLWVQGSLRSGPLRMEEPPTLIGHLLYTQVKRELLSLLQGRETGSQELRICSQFLFPQHTWESSNPSAYGLDG